MLEDIVSISELADSNKLLFWTIMRISSYRHPTFHHIFKILDESYRNLLASSLLPPINDFRTLQAIILICYWPTSGERQSDDPGWQLSGMAMNAAMQMGLDQPGPGRRLAGFSGKSNAHHMAIRVRYMTWIAIFFINSRYVECAPSNQSLLTASIHSIAIFLGLPAQISSPNQTSTIIQMAQDPQIPRHFLIQVEIQRHILAYSTALSGDMDSSTSATLANFFSSELDMLLNTYQDSWSPQLEIQFLAAKLNLFSICLHTSAGNGWQIPQIMKPGNLDSPRRFLNLGFQPAISLIHNMAQLKQVAQSFAGGACETFPVEHYPKYYPRMLMFAVVFLINFLRTELHATQQDRDLAISHISTAHQFFANFARTREITRVAETIEHLVNGFREQSMEGLPPIKSRLGASLMYNALKHRTPEKITTSNTALSAAELPDHGLDNESAKEHPCFVMENVPISLNPDPEDTNLGLPLFDMDENIESLPWLTDDALFDVFNF